MVQWRDLGMPRGAGRRSLGIDDPLDRGEHALAHAGVECAHVELDDGLVGNNVFLCAGLQRTDGDHRSFCGRDLARDNRLQSHHRRRRHHDRIDAGLRHRSMRAASEQTDLQAIGGRGDGPGASGYGASWPDHDVLAKHDSPASGSG